MGRRLTYTLSDLRKLAKDVPYSGLPVELLNEAQRNRRAEGEKKFCDAYKVYKREKGVYGRG